ncbi:MAG: TetR/AcrR family transcriptional regulator [Coriobacteriales bacterium]|jgi:AcrR family transcriptional regulator|nr:TetR/AcrR family transcriptional regulator [Coriobacteriales bacterium]
MTVNGTTQKRIFETALRLFSDLGVPRVSMRDIAKEVGISAAAIYNHFPSKDSILDALYEFYIKTQKRYQPDFDILLGQCKTAPLPELFAQMDFHYEPKLEEMMDRIVVIASSEARFDKRSADFIEKSLLLLPDSMIIPLLRRLMELGRIEPVDLEGIRILYSNYVYAAAVRQYSPFPLSLADWRHGLATLSTLVKPVASA